MTDTYLTPGATWDDVLQIETTDPVEGGPPNPATKAGIDNVPHLQLLNRTQWLRSVLESVAAVVGVEIPAGGHAMSADHVLMRNATASPITIATGTTAAQLVTDGFSEAFDLAASQAEVNAYSAVDKFVTPEKLAARTMDAVFLKQSAQTVAHDVLTRMLYSANGGAVDAHAGGGATRFSFSNSNLTLSKAGIYAVRLVGWQTLLATYSADIYAQINLDATVLAGVTGGAAHNLWTNRVEAFAVFQGAIGQVLTFDVKQVNSGGGVRSMNAYAYVHHIA